MKYSGAFKARKYALKSGFYTILFIGNVLKTGAYWVKRLHHDAVSNEGMCGHCHSLDIEFTHDNAFTKDTIHKYFICNKCGRAGKEIKKLTYLKTDMKQPDKEPTNGTSEFTSSESAEHQEPKD